MSLSSTMRGYGAMARLLHWGVALLVAAQIVIALRAWKLPLGDDKFALLLRHRSFGITILGLVVIRLGWRWANGVPALPDSVGAAARALRCLSRHYPSTVGSLTFK